MGNQTREGFLEISITADFPSTSAFDASDAVWISNALSTFIRTMNQVLHSFIGKFAVVYFDDILGYSATPELHLQCLRVVLTVFQKERQSRAFMGRPEKRFIPHFSTIMTPIMDCMKRGKFTSSKATSQSFELIKQKLTSALVLVLPDFSQPFELHCDASKVGIGIVVVLSQNSQPVAYYSEKLNGANVRYSTYDVEF